MSRRILVALDSSAGSRAALNQAVALARRFEAELAGVFVEDENLRRLAELPFATELGGGTGRRALSPETMEREMLREARQLETELEQVARAGAVPWSFRVARGLVGQALLDASTGEELVVLGMAGRSPGPVRLGSTARHLLQRASCTLLLVSPVAAAEGPDRGVLVVYDGTASGRAALDRARDLAGDVRALTVLLLADSPARVEVLRRQAGERLGDLRPVFEHLTAADPERLARALLERAPSTLVLGELPQLGPDALEALLERLDGAVLQVRQAG